MKKSSRVWLIFASLFLFAGCSLNTANQTAETANIRLTLGGTSGTFYIQGTATADFINKQDTNLRATPNTSGGTVDNIRRVAAGEAEFGLAATGDLFTAWRGEDPFDETMQNLRVVGPAQKPAPMHVVVLSSSGINEVGDLIGKRFVSGSPGSNAAIRMESLLMESNLYEEINVEQLPWSELPTLMKDRVIAGYSRTGHLPAPDVVELNLTSNIRLLDLGELIESSSFLDKYPFVQAITIPAGTYEGQENDIQTFAEPFVWFANADLSDEVVYDFTNMIYSDESIAAMDSAYKNHSYNSVDEFAASRSIPVHDGAKRYWDERGVQLAEPALE